MAHISEYFRLVRNTPYVLKLALSAGLGGLLDGYNIGVISGALLYIEDEFEEVSRTSWLQETIVIMTVAGAIVGAGIGGWLNDKIGRKPSIMVADGFFFIGALVMAFSPTPIIILPGRLLVGFGIGMVSMTCPLYISDSSPSSIRGAMVSTNAILLTGGHFLSCLLNLYFSHTKGTWRWMLGAAAIPAMLQLVIMIFLPESPRWLYRKGMTAEAQDILEKIYPAELVMKELRALKQSVEDEISELGELANAGMFKQVKMALQNKVFCRALPRGVTVQVAQQFVGVNALMYYSPTIIQHAGYTLNRTALALSLLTSGLNFVGTLANTVCVDKYGRRRLMMISVTGIIIGLVVLAQLFYQAAAAAPMIDYADSIDFGVNATCPSYLNSKHPGNWSCITCLRAADHCGFCNLRGNMDTFGACVLDTPETRSLCNSTEGQYYSHGCPGHLGFLAILLMGALIISYSLGMGTVPWIYNSEIYPLQFRGVGGGIAAVSNWSSNLLVTETFLTLTEVLGPAATFLLFAAISMVALIAIFFLVPETKGLPLDEIEQMLGEGFMPSWPCWCVDGYRLLRKGIMMVFQKERLEKADRLREVDRNSYVLFDG